MVQETKKPVKYVLIREGDEGDIVERFSTKEELEADLLKRFSYTNLGKIEVYEVEPFAVTISIVPKITLPNGGE